MGLFEKDKNILPVEAAVGTAERADWQQDQETEESEKATEQKRKPFALWEVGGNTFKLKLKTSSIVELETRYKTNLMNIMGAGNGGMPALSVMLDVAHVAMKDFQHGITKAEVQNIFDQYVDEGGSQLSFYTSVYMEVFAVSGFFSANVSSQMTDAIAEAAETL